MKNIVQCNGTSGRYVRLSHPEGPIHYDRLLYVGYRNEHGQYARMVSEFRPQKSSEVSLERTGLTVLLLLTAYWYCTSTDGLLGLLERSLQREMDVAGR
jgi:hypothetical protein